MEFKVEPLKLSPLPNVTLCKFLPASVMTKELGVRVAMLTLPEVMLKPEKEGEADVLTSWLMLEVPETVKVLVPRLRVPVPF